MYLREITKIMYLLAIFVGVLITANVMAGIKLVNLMGFVVPVGFIAYSISFPITDVVDEVWGKELARKFVWAGFIANVFMLLLVYLGYLMPPLIPEMQRIYTKALIPVGRIVLASMIAYLISQHHDVWAFRKWREVTNGKYLWLRNNASTLVSQLIDTIIFITIAFYGLVPTNVLLVMISSQYVWKVVVALIDTPFVYLGVWLVRRNTIIMRPYGWLE